MVGDRVLFYAFELPAYFPNSSDSQVCFSSKVSETNFIFWFYGDVYFWCSLIKLCISITFDEGCDSFVLSVLCFDWIDGKDQTHLTKNGFRSNLKKVLIFISWIRVMWLGLILNSIQVCHFVPRWYSSKGNAVVWFGFYLRWS